jgi:hypothetical protein
MLKRTERLPTRASGNDLPFFKEYQDEVLYKLEIQYVESHPSTPRSKDSKQEQQEEISKASGPR